jgi:hypothetical protein
VLNQRKSLLRGAGAVLLIFVLVACGGGPEPASNGEAEAGLAEAAERLAAAQEGLAETSRRLGGARQAESLIAAAQGGLRTALEWRDARPRLIGEFFNETEETISSLRVGVSRTKGMRGSRNETLVLSLDPFAVPGARVSLNAEASPYVWGFQPEEEPAGFLSVVVEEITLANGRIIQPQPAVVQRIEDEVSEQRRAISQLRLEIEGWQRQKAGN